MDEEGSLPSCQVENADTYVIALLAFPACILYHWHFLKRECMGPCLNGTVGKRPLKVQAQEATREKEVSSSTAV